jgi:hypothetical protein
MTVFLILTAIAYGIFQTGCIIQLVVKGYQGWTLFWKNYDRLPISTVLTGDTRDASFSDASGSVSSATDNVIERHPQSGQPAQTAPGGEHHPGLAGFPLADGAFVHIQPVGQLAVSQGISPRTSWISSTVGFCQCSPLTSV